MALDLEQKQLLSKARLVGPGTALPVVLGDGELAKLVSVILADVGRTELVPRAVQLPAGTGWDYYSLPLSWFSSGSMDLDFSALYDRCLAEVQDFQTYFKCLCELHKRRRKYEMILSAQPLPTSLQIAPRALLEFGVLASPALASCCRAQACDQNLAGKAQQLQQLQEQREQLSTPQHELTSRNRRLRRQQFRQRGMSPPLPWQQRAPGGRAATLGTSRSRRRDGRCREFPRGELCPPL